MKPINIEEGLKFRHPEGVALIVCKDKTGNVDVTPIGWFTVCNSEPWCWAICLYNSHFSRKVISDTNEYVLCLPSFSQKDDVAYCGSVHGWDTDKLEHCQLQTIPSKLIKPPLIKDAIACYECKVIRTCDAGDHTIFIGEIVAAYVSGKKDKLYNHGNHSFFEWKVS